MIDAIITPTIRSPHNYPTHFATSLADTLRVTYMSIRDNTIADARNDGLTAARALGYQQVMFLDDDIRVSPRQIQHAASLLGAAQVVAFRPTDFPDNSVVRHAARLTGIPTEVHPSGSAMLVDLTKIPAGRMFMNIYNEDWLFMHGLTVADAGEAEQLPYDPFTPGRAAREELGDLIAEAVKGKPMTTSLVFWEDAIRERELLLRSLSHLAGPAGVSVREAMEELGTLTAEKAARQVRMWDMLSGLELSARIAQWIMRRFPKPEGEGSNPSASTVVQLMVCCSRRRRM